MQTHETVSRRDAQDPKIRQYLDEIDALRLDARALAQDLTPEQFNWRPDPRRWSVGQCLQHITLTARLYPTKIERMIEESRERTARGERPYREGWFGRWFVGSMEPPAKMRARTMASVVPPAVLDPDIVLRSFDEAHAELADLVRRADGVSLVHARTASPFLSLLRFTLNQTIAINLAHGRRHLWQARQVMATPGFPAPRA
jgi:hypothetical protein